MRIIKTQLDYQNQKTNALVFLPEIDGESKIEVKSTFAILTHGYTSDKSSILNWAVRLCEVGVSCILFDLPGHYLGNFSEVSDFEYFKNHAHELFYAAFLNLKNYFSDEFPSYENLLQPDKLKIVFSGHSLGGLLSLKAMMLKEFKDYEKCAIAVGLGMAPKDSVHLFDTPFYKSTLRIREQLVSLALSPKNIFPWIKMEKEVLDVHEMAIHLITGVDDIVVGNDGMERFAESLGAKKNRVTTERPTRLPHHEPELAASYVKKYLKKINWV